MGPPPSRVSSPLLRLEEIQPLPQFAQAEAKWACHDEGTPPSSLPAGRDLEFCLDLFSLWQVMGTLNLSPKLLALL